MKKLTTFLIAVFIIIIANISSAIAQENYQDVIYLKNGSVYRGVIIEQVPNKYYKLRQADSTVIEFQTSLVERVTREPKETINTAPVIPQTGAPAADVSTQPEKMYSKDSYEKQKHSSYFIGGYLTVDGSLPYIYIPTETAARVGYNYGPNAVGGIRFGKSTYFVGIIGYHWGASYTLRDEISSSDADFRFAGGLAGAVGKMIVSGAIGQVYFTRELKFIDRFTGKEQIVPQKQHSILLSGFVQLRMSDEIAGLAGVDFYFFDSSAYVSIRLGIGVSTLFF